MLFDHQTRIWIKDSYCKVHTVGTYSSIESPVLCTLSVSRSWRSDLAVTATLPGMYARPGSSSHLLDQFLLPPRLLSSCAPRWQISGPRMSWWSRSPWAGVKAVRESMFRSSRIYSRKPTSARNQFAEGGRWVFHCCSRLTNLDHLKTKTEWGLTPVFAHSQSVSTKTVDNLNNFQDNSTITFKLKTYSNF